jgi:hypothetical protein
MGPAPRTFAELPLDAELGVPVPFACGTPDQPPSTWPDGRPSARSLDHRRVTQCALSRVCSVCGAGLGRPLTLFGSRAELDRLAFHLPPAHAECVTTLLESWRGVDAALAGQPAPLETWTVVTTGGFEYLRPIKGQRETRAVFEPNSLLSQREVELSPSVRASG